MSDPQEFDFKESVDFLLQSFKLERYIYLGLTFISVLLLGGLIYGLYRHNDITGILAMLGPSGLITFSFTRVLKMWTDCTELLKIYISKK